MEIKREKDFMEMIIEDTTEEKELKAFTTEIENVFDTLFKDKEEKALDIQLPHCEIYSFDDNIYMLKDHFMLEMTAWFRKIYRKNISIRPNTVKVEHKDNKLEISFASYTGYVTADVKTVVIVHCDKEKYDNLVEELKEEGLTPEMINVCKEVLNDPHYLDSKDNVIDWLKKKVAADAESIIHAFQVGGLIKTKTLREQDLVEKFNKLKETSLYNTARFSNCSYVNDDAMAIVTLNTVIRIFQRIPVITYAFE